MVRILFVCTGNICRSPSAEAVFKHYVRMCEQEQNYDIHSAGTHGYHVGEKPDRRAIQAAKKRDISMEGMTASKVSVEDFEAYHHIVAMDQEHLRILSAMKPKESRSELSLFSDYTMRRNIKNVPDPYYGDEQGFEEVLDILEDGMENLFRHVSKT